MVRIINEDKTPIFWFNIDGRTLLSRTKPRESIKELGLDTLLPSIVNIIPGYYEPSLEPKELGSVVVTLGGPDIWPIIHVITSSRNSALLLSSNICINIK